MDGNEQAALDTAMSALVAQITADTKLQPELQRARRTFLGESEDGSQRAVGAAAERRFFEWFALERESETLGQVPAAVARYGADEDLLGSMAGAFAVTAVTPQWVTARDLQDGTMLEFDVPAGSLAAGDLVAGRVFTVGAGRWCPSTAASVFRPGGSLGEAFERDVGGLELDRRLLQIELEHTLLRPHQEGRLGVADVAGSAPVSAPLEHLEANLDRLLQGQSEQYSATAISEQLAVVERPGQVIGPLLERIAFETKADLDAVRRVLLEIWSTQHAQQTPAATADTEDAGAPGETLGERMVRRLDEGIGKKRDLDDVFGELEDMAGLEPGAADDAENPFDRAEGDEIIAGGAGGNLTALVQEFLWETGAADGAVARTLHTWVELQGNAAVPNLDLEDVSGIDLMRLLLHVFLAAGPAQRGPEVRAAFAALREFYAWAERTQDLDLAANLTACRGALLDQLDRLAAVSSGLSTTAVSKHRPALFEIEEVGPKGFGMRDDDGGGFWLDVPDSACDLLRVGDLVLGALTEAGGFAGPVVVLPAEARALME